MFGTTVYPNSIAFFVERDDGLISGIRLTLS